MQRFACRTFGTTVPCAPSGSPVLAKSSNTIGCHTKRTMNGTCYRLAVCAPSSTPQGPRVNTAELPSRPPDSIPPSVQCFGRSVCLRPLGDGTVELHGVGANQKGSRAPAPSDRSKASRTEQGKGRPWQPAPTNRPPWGQGTPLGWPQSDLSDEGAGQAGATTGDGDQDPQAGLQLGALRPTGQSGTATTPLRSDSSHYAVRPKLKR